FLLSSCGERGPVGPEGPPGPNILPTSFEFPIDLTLSNGFEFIREIPGQIEVLNSDVMIAYVLEDYIEEDDMDVWRQLPVTDFNNRGTRLFDFDFTRVDLRLFLDANYSLGAADELRDVLVRAVHIPADFVNNAKAKDLQNAKSVQEIEQILGTEVQDLELQ
ncbi:MAG: hypothetical protein WD607_10210, partial [Candidatus Paceibacterota bacterium]